MLCNEASEKWLILDLLVNGQIVSQKDKECSLIVFVSVHLNHLCRYHNKITQFNYVISNVGEVKLSKEIAIDLQSL